jgi:hypothetical protein
MTLPTREALAAWRALANPAELFLEIWREAKEWRHATRYEAPGLTTAIKKRLADGLLSPQADIAVKKVVDVIVIELEVSARSSVSSAGEGLLLGVMREIDWLFLSIHPRTPKIPPGAHKQPRIPDWLHALAREREILGFYCEAEDIVVLPRGPLCRDPRTRIAASGDRLSDQFEALSIAARSSQEDHRCIQVRIEVFGGDPTTGVPPGRPPGRERVVFVPLAEKASDLIATVVEPNPGRFFLDVQPATHLEPARLLLEALRLAGAADLALAPELIVPESALADVSKALSIAEFPLPRLLLAGSGLTDARDADGRSWNEARFINSVGRVLARQRKIWPYGMTSQRARDLGLTDPGDDELLMENISSSNDLLVCDIANIGRCLILICQDLQSFPLVGDIIADYQPDWIITPILDIDINDHHWSMQRSYELSALSQARFMIVNSLSQAYQKKSPLTGDPIFGLAIGPRDPALPAQRPREIAQIRARSSSSPLYGEVTWNDGSLDWRQIGVSLI